MTGPRRYSAAEFAALVLDEHSLVPLPGFRTDTDDPGYRDELAAARERTGLSCAVLAGTGRLHGREVVLVAGEFGFLGGSMGRAEGDALLAAVDHATEHRLPVLVGACSGGTRMQEGTPALVQMVKVAQAVAGHRRAGLAYLVHQRHPTTGGALASFASLGQYTTAEPGALVGFLGPRVQEVVSGERLPDGVQRAENLARVGVIDAVLPSEQVRERWHALLQTIAGEPGPVPAEVPVVDGPAEATQAAPTAEPVDPWQAVLTSRLPGRPGPMEVVAACGEDVVWLSGTGDGQRDDTTRVALARLSGRPCVVVAHDRAAEEMYPLGPAALRMAQRGFQVAQELRLPLVNLVDTAGAACSVEGEEQALCGEIARCTTQLADLTVPTVSVVVGRGTGGATLALLPADRTLCAENGWVAPLPPEGASAITHRTADRAPEMARAHRIIATELVAAGLADEVIPEPAAFDEQTSADFCRRVGAAVARHLAELAALPDEERESLRRQRFRAFG